MRKIPPNSESSVLVTTRAARIYVPGPCRTDRTKWTGLVVKGIVNVIRNRPFHVRAADLSGSSIKVPKHKNLAE